MIQYNHERCRYRSNTSTVTTGDVSIATFASGAGVPVGIRFSGNSLHFFLFKQQSQYNPLK